MLEVRTTAHNGSVEIEVADTGAASPANTSRIFDSLLHHQGQRPRYGPRAFRELRHHQGHAGKIDVRSTPGKGTSFHVEFPAVRKAVHV